MRIAFISACRKESTGGHVRVAQEMARAFARQHDVLLIYPDDATRRAREGERLTIREVRSAGEGDAAFPALLPRDVRALAETLSAFAPDIVHAQDFPTLGQLSQIWARRHGVPFVHTAHLLPERYLDFGASEAARLLDNRLAERATRAAFRRFISGCDALIMPNQTGADSFRRFDYAGKLFVIPNGRDLARYSAAGCPAVAAGPRQLIFVGWISHRKNQG
jgi:glycosyltransferase involved in cell wall biosynthesis